MPKAKHLAAALAALAALSIQAQPVASGPTAERYNVEPTHTFVTWEARHFGTSTSRGRFDKKDGFITIDRASSAGKVDISIDMASISTGVAPFDGHLRSADFFNVQAHPSAVFKGDFKLDGNKVSSVTGQLTMLGVTKPVMLKANFFNCFDHPRFRKQVCGGDFEATVKRSEFGMSYGLPGIPDDIRLLIQIEAVAQ
jgi:polyisoprenoid-binding protein YceI